MEFSLFNLMSRPANGPTHAEVLAQMRAMTHIADQAKFDVVWFAEHHLSNYCISPSPLMAAIHMAGETKCVRLGPAVIVMPFYEPLRLVEDICYADQLTAGRLVLGLGTGYQPREFKKFGFEVNDRLKRGIEIWDCIEQGLSRGVINYKGDHVHIEDAALAIRPLQKKIRTFAVGNAPEWRQKMVDYGAELLCTPSAGPNSILTTTRKLFQETRSENGLVGDDFSFAVQRYVYIARDKADARAAAEQILVHVRMANNMRQAEPSMDGPNLAAPAFDGEPDIDAILERALVGSAEDVAERIVDEAHTFGITHFSIFTQIAAIPYREALRSIETFGDRVIPAVQAALNATQKVEA